MMKTDSNSLSNAYAAIDILTVLAAAYIFIIFATFNGVIDFAYRVAIIALGVLGLAVHLRSPERKMSFQFANWMLWVGGMLGVLALVMVVSAILGIQLPLVYGYRGTFFALVGVMLLKWLLASLRPLSTFKDWMSKYA
jgi:hypothetical protein